MSYKTLFSAVTNASVAAPALDYAATMSAAWDAHLDVMCLGVDRSQTSYYEVGANAAILQAAVEQAQEKAADLQTAVDEKLRKTDARWNSYLAVAAVPDAGRPVSRRARFADLAVMPLPYGDKRGTEDPIMLEAALFNAGCPVVCIPEGAKAEMPKHVVVGWNESAEALRAIRASLPYLQAADVVHVAVIDPPSHGPDRSDPGGPLAGMLSRHGVHCDISVMARSGGRIGDVLSQHVADKDAGLLVMGGYGHSRFREAVMGGATRYMLEHAKVPVFMAH